MEPVFIKKRIRCCFWCPEDSAKEEEPKGEFILADGDEPIAVYAYCNLHGFWKTKII